MPILGVGVDVLHLPRLVALVQRRSSERLANRILSTAEVSVWRNIQAESARIQFLGVRWGVKEAAYKALYPTVRPVWKDLTFVGLGKNGSKPSLVFHPSEVVGGSRHWSFHVSVSHDGEYIFATVVVESINEVAGSM